jgi:hypothetical protein
MPQARARIGAAYGPKDKFISLLAMTISHMDRKVLFAFLYILIFPALILILSGDLLWPEGVAFCLWLLALCYSTILYLSWRDPGLLAERYKMPGEKSQAGWDRYIVYGIFLLFIIWITIMPLDAKRFGCPPSSRSG